MLTGFLAVDADAGARPGTQADGYGTAAAAAAATRLGRRPDPGRCRTTSTPTRRCRNELNLLRQGNSRRSIKRQPADAAGRRRPAVRAAGLRPGRGARRRTRCCSACWSRSATRSASPPPWTRRSTRCSVATPGRAAMRHRPATSRAGNPAGDAQAPTCARPSRRRQRPCRTATRPSPPGTSPPTARPRRRCSAAINRATEAEARLARVDPRAATSRRPRRPRHRRRRPPVAIGDAVMAIWHARRGGAYCERADAGWSSSVARWAHNPEVAGSNPAPATRENAP